MRVAAEAVFVNGSRYSPRLPRMGEAGGDGTGQFREHHPGSRALARNRLPGLYRYAINGRPGDFAPNRNRIEFG